MVVLDLLVTAFGITYPDLVAESVDRHVYRMWKCGAFLNVAVAY
jgi:hypothetical protein